jgi:hypothetical protein
MKTPPVKQIRCAIYTRVSTEQGLDQEFNSLDAQYDAASAYIKSQAHAGWTLIRSRYDDGGYSGGSTDRPDLQSCDPSPRPKRAGGLRHSQRLTSMAAAGGLSLSHGSCRKSDRLELEKAPSAARLDRCPWVISKFDRLARSAFLSRLLEANVDVRFAELPQIEGATGRFLLQEMVAVAGIGGRHGFRAYADGSSPYPLPNRLRPKILEFLILDKSCLRICLGDWLCRSGKKRRGKKLGGHVSLYLSKRGAAANRMHAVAGAADLAPHDC